MTEPNRRANLEREWRLSDEAWEEGLLLLRGGHPRGALTRFYYSAFHAACAALLAEGTDVATHAGVRNQFNQLFIKSGRLNRDLARSLASLQQQREDADYERQVEIDAEQASWARDDAAHFRSTVAAWLRQNGWLGE